MAKVVSVAQQQRKVDDTVLKDQAELIPDIIEEKRKDSEGRLHLTKYLKGKLLGKGGFAKCFLGTQIPSDRQYALKIVYKSTLMKSSAKHKLQTEIKIHRTLRHTHVVKFERFFEDNTNVYMVLELCSNNSMSNLLKRRKKLTEIEVRYYLSQLISGLQYLHENLVIHRDLKLGNLFVDDHMRMKIGDFGLATKMTDALERKKTFCGTPNYIAPEVLEGKNGHSFEVDFWSTGVIMYTLLEGRPPFESKNVESTYKRILANSYSFSDQQSVCDSAKSLIGEILQTKPEARPTLDQMLAHSFFTGPGTYIPEFLPESALRDPPVFPTAQLGDGIDVRKLIARIDNEMYGDENDANGANRIQNNLNTNLKRNYTAEQQDVIKPARTVPSSGGNIESFQYKVEKENSNSNAVLKASSSLRPATTTTTGVTIKSRSATASGLTDPNLPQKRERLITTPTVPEKRTNTHKFEIFEDVKSSHQIPHDGPGSLFLEKEKSKMTSSDVMVKGPVPRVTNVNNENINENKNENKYENKYENTNENRNEMHPFTLSENKSNLQRMNKNSTNTSPTDNYGPRSGMSSGSVSDTPETNDIDQLQTQLKFIHINKMTEKQSENRSGPSKLPSRSNEVNTQSAWITDNSEKPLNKQYSTAIAPKDGHNSPPQDRIKSNHAVYVQESNVHSPGRTSEPMHLATPTNKIYSVNEHKGLCTLEGMHEVLSSRDLDDLHPLKGYTGRNHSSYNMPLIGLNHANIWVTRYVDYTSKYGLGFLLNTGSAGVYFNDSTKIVISPDGSIFQYSERKKKEKGSSSSEHITQTHSVLKFPIELQKKVTLLRHFRNYLIDRQNEGLSGDDGSAVGGSEAMEKMATLEGASSGSNPSIPFGKSSAAITYTEAANMGCTNMPTRRSSTEMLTGENIPDMPFVKKWVRTKYAILFRLSNRTVQVLFTDRSEVLLTSEAHMVTYVSKQNIRSEHSLEEIIQTGRSDIAKRLKYAKDIMFRLINTQAR